MTSPPRLASRPKIFLLAIIGAIIGLTVIGWGQMSPEPTNSRPTRPVSLAATLTYTLTPGVAPKVATLTCGAHPLATGYLADRGLTGACIALNKLATASKKDTAPTQICTELWGGPQSLTITGTGPGTESASHWRAHLDRSNGCQIAAFEAARALMPAAAGREGQHVEL